jgi:hypothetical protein
VSYDALPIPDRYQPEPKAPTPTLQTIGGQTPLYWAIKSANLDMEAEVLDFDESLLQFEE